jgi:diadenosine tetraphosphatase ApaH/serine/threonine PP2A family protein phosphatase
VIEQRELELAREHPRGTERRRLLPYRAALNDTAEYAALSPADRDVIVRWAETRRLIKERHGIDHDPANLADPLIPAARLRAHVIAGEHRVAGRGDTDDPGGDLLEIVSRIRGT